MQLQDAEMVDDETCFGMAVDHRGAGIDIAPAQDVHREVMAHCSARAAVQLRVIGIAPAVLFQDAGLLGGLDGMLNIEGRYAG